MIYYIHTRNCITCNASVWCYNAASTFASSLIGKLLSSLCSLVKETDSAVLLNIYVNIKDIWMWAVTVTLWDLEMAVDTLSSTAQSLNFA